MFSDRVGPSDVQLQCRLHYNFSWTFFFKLALAMILTPEQEWNFLRKIAMFSNENGCLEWLGSIRNRTGYGAFSIDSKNVCAHRVAWVLKHGYWPDEYILHTCDNKLCVNADHLYEGDYSDNAVDRSNRCHRHSTLKLTPREVFEICELLKLGLLTQKQIGEKYGITQSEVSNISTNKRWNHLTQRRELSSH